VTTGAPIRIEALSRHYETSAGVVRAVDGVTIEVEAGTSLAVTGPSGCGKSTLLGLIAGLESPSAGSVSLCGHELATLPERERERLRRDEVGLVFQADNLLPFLTALENVELQAALNTSGSGPNNPCLTPDYSAAGLLARLGVGEQAGKLPDQLSGGQRQRVAVARALINRPRVILADEPTGALDEATSQVVVEALQEAQRELGATLVLVTHDLALAGRLDRRLRLRDGRVAGDA
jgi:putative ABC transport system ATP-binding protein